MDLWLSRATSRPPSLFPATAIIDALTDRELPQVEKKAERAPTASAISSSARVRYSFLDRRSSIPPDASRSERKLLAPRTAVTRGSMPAFCRWAGGVNPYRPSRW